MANRNNQTAAQAAAKQEAAAQPNPAPVAGGEQQSEGGTQPDQPDGEADPKELAAQVQQLQTELQAERQTTSELEVKYNAALAAVPLYDDPYEALSEEEFATVLEIVLGIAHNRGIVTTQQDETQDEAEETSGEPAEDDPHAETRELLKRFSLKAAYILPDGSTCFDEQHAKHVAGADFDSLTVISAE